MSNQTLCPQCRLEIDSERIRQEVIICPHCGFTKSTSQTQLQTQMDRRTIRITIAVAVLFTLAFIQSVNWDQYFFSIVPLKAKQVLGFADSDDLNQVARICRERGKPQCVENALAEVVQLEPSNLAALARYGKVLVLRRKMAEAIPVLDHYFKIGGISLDAAYDYARALKVAGDTDKASEYFQFILKAKPHLLQITVTQSYVDLLMQKKQWRKAKRLIEQTRRRGVNTGYFMQTELEEIKQRL